jgi:hemerythrin HHE cation binding domain-containing protein
MSASETIDFTMMYATHDAFRRDLDRLVAASAAGAARTAEVRAGWENFKAQLTLHHTVEDTELWPRVHRAVVGQQRDLALLEAMESEHAQIDPLLKEIDSALSGDASRLAETAREASAVLGHHLQHEEDEALPLIQSVLTRADWSAFAGEMRRRQGVKGAAVYVPWILDGMPDAKQRRFLNALPAPVKVVNRLFWQPSYQRRQLWGFAG